MVVPSHQKTQALQGSSCASSKGAQKLEGAQKIDGAFQKSLSEGGTQFATVLRVVGSE